MAYVFFEANKRCLGQNYKIIPQKKKEKRRKEKRKGKKREKERKEKRKEKRKGKREEERKEKRKGRGEGGGGREGRRTEEERIPCQRHRLNLEVQKDVGCLSVIINSNHLLFIAFNLEPV